MVHILNLIDEHSTELFKILYKPIDPPKADSGQAAPITRQYNIKSTLNKTTSQLDSGHKLFMIKP